MRACPAFVTCPLPEQGAPSGKREIDVKIIQTIIGVILLGLGALWILQGANVLAGSVMSGQSQWLYIGIVVAVLGLALLWWTYRRRA